MSEPNPNERLTGQPGLPRFDFICDKEGLHPAPQVSQSDTVSRDSKRFVGIYTDGGGGFINPLNGRGVRMRMTPLKDPGLWRAVYFCFDGPPIDPRETGQEAYRGVNRGMVENREEAEQWLHGKQPEGLIFIEGLSERVNG